MQQEKKRSWARPAFTGAIILMIGIIGWMQYQRFYETWPKQALAELAVRDAFGHFSGLPGDEVVTNLECQIDATANVFRCRGIGSHLHIRQFSIRENGQDVRLVARRDMNGKVVAAEIHGVPDEVSKDTVQRVMDMFARPLKSANN